MRYRSLVCFGHVRSGANMLTNLRCFFFTFILQKLPMLFLSFWPPNRLYFILFLIIHNRGLE